MKIKKIKWNNNLFFKETGFGSLAEQKGFGKRRGNVVYGIKKAKVSFMIGQVG